MPTLISDIKGTITDFDQHVEMEQAYFHRNAVEAIMKLRGVDEETARKDYYAIIEHEDRNDPDYRTVYVPAVSRVATIGYRNGDLSLADCIRDGVEDTFRYIKDDSGRIVLVGLSDEESTRASMASVDLEKYVDAVYCSNRVGSKKDATAMRHIAQQEGVDLRECLYVDDKLAHVKGAQMAEVGQALWMTDTADSAVETGVQAVSSYGDIKAYYDKLR